MRSSASAAVNVPELDAIFNFASETNSKQPGEFSSSTKFSNLLRFDCLADYFSVKEGGGQFPMKGGYNCKRLLFYASPEQLK